MGDLNDVTLVSKDNAVIQAAQFEGVRPLEK